MVEGMLPHIPSHDTGRYVGKHALWTPNHQRLANEGPQLRYAHSAAPTWFPNRTALLFGQAPHSVGMLGLAIAASA